MAQVEIAPGHEVPQFIVGLWQLSEGHRGGGMSNSDAMSLLSELADAGFTAFDCADIYTGVEELLGEFRRRYRNRRGADAADRIRVHTKFVPDRDALASVDRAYVERIIDRSLSRLAVDRLDLVQFAWWDYEVPGYVDAALWLDELRRAGKIRRLGVTNFDVPRLGEIVEAGVPISTQQVQYSLLDRRPEHAMAGFCAGRGIHLLCYGALAGGFFSERYLGVEAAEPPFETRSLTKYRLMIEEAGGWGRFQELLQIMTSIAERTGVTIAQVALRWVLERPAVTATLVGLSSADRLLALPRALELSLSAEDRGLLAAWMAAGPSPAGDVFGLERDPSGPHARIMKYNLNRTQSKSRPRMRRDA